VKRALAIAFIVAATTIATDAAPAVVVTDAWSRPAIDTGVVYARIANRGAVADRLDAASAPVARVTELHRSMATGATMNGMAMGGVMSMVPVRALIVPAHGTLVLSPGGNHLMLIGLRGDLRAGRSFPLRLHFGRAGWTTVIVRVRPI
jgi:copper(I)-binding protein